MLVALALRRWKSAAWAGLLIASILAGFSYADLRAQWRLTDRLADDMEGRDVQIIGRVVDLPQTFERGTRFGFEPVAAPAGIPSQLALSWYSRAKGNAPSDVPPIHAGEQWLLTVRLRKVHGSLNPHGFDYEGWMFERGIAATGYVRPGGQMRLDDFDPTFMGYVDHWREVIRARFVHALPDSAWRGILVALAIGDQAAIPKDQWTLFRKTGTTHLMSISGLHITLVAALVAAILGAVWRRTPWLVLRLPAQKAAVLAGFLAAAAYVLLSGYGVPSQRTLYMLGVAASAMWLERGAGAVRVMSVALLVVLLLDPWAVLSAGFWLSFGAVGVLLWMSAAVPESTGRWRWLSNWLRAQWAVTLFTLPMLLGLFQQFSLVSPLANALAIPLVSMVVTPLALIFAVLPLPSLAELANWLLGLLMQFLQACADLPHALWQQAAPPAWLIAGCCGVALWALLPRGVPGRWVGLLLFVPLLAWTPVRPGVGEAQVTVLDVGQGLAVHVRTATHDLLYDTGPQYSPEMDAGKLIIAPYLHAEGTRRLDMLMVSHVDADHSGGAASVLAEFPVADFRGSLPADSALLELAPYQSCLRGQAWEWDGVRFAVLNPLPDQVGQGNNGSCVLRVEASGRTVLLTGDVQVRAEDDMLATLGGQLHADVVVAPHHGSHSSSQEAFVAATAARYAVFTAGYRNRYHHPAPEVVARYVQQGAVPLRSDADGAIGFLLQAKGIEVSRYRQEAAHYWSARGY